MMMMIYDLFLVNLRRPKIYLKEQSEIHSIFLSGFVCTLDIDSLIVTYVRWNGRSIRSKVGSSAAGITGSNTVWARMTHGKECHGPFSYIY